MGLGPQSDTDLQINFNVRTLLSFCDVSIDTEFSISHVADFECCSCAFLFIMMIYFVKVKILDTYISILKWVIPVVCI